MGVSDTLTKEVVGVAVLVLIIVVLAIVITSFKTQNVGSVICGGTYPTYNATDNLCYATNGSSFAVSSTGQQLVNSLDTSVTAIQSPIQWVSIIVIIVIVAWLVVYLKGKTKGMSG